MKTLMFARKTLLEFWRSPQLFWLFLLFPAMMVLLYYFAFGMNTGMSNYLTVLVENRDQGTLGAEFVTVLREAEFDGKPAFSLIELDSQHQAETILNEGKASALVTLPVDFSQAITQPNAQPADVALLGDPLGDTFAFSQSFIQGLLQLFIDQKTGWNQPLPFETQFLPNTGTLNDFQVGVPGLVIFGELFGVISIAILLTRERSAGTLKRIKLSKADSFHFLGGIFAASLVLAVAQMLITLGTAYFVGFKPVGSFFLAVGIGVLASMGATGAGFIAAVFSKNEGEATGFGTGLMAPLVFLSGAIFPLPGGEMFNLFGRPIQWNNLMPSTFASKALSQVILFGKPLHDLSFELTALVILTAIWLVFGIWFYQRRVLRKAE